MKKIIMTLLCLSGLSACSNLVPPAQPLALKPPGARGVLPSEDKAAAIKAHQQARQRWHNNQTSGHYIYTLNYTPTMRAPIRIRVQDNRVVQAMTVPDNQPLPIHQSHQVLTVEDLFIAARTALNNEVENIQVWYDPEFGYPTFISRGGIDGGLYKASGLRMLRRE